MKKQSHYPKGVCPNGTFVSADGGTQCKRCHLYPDLCTCRPDHPMWRILLPAFGIRPRRRAAT